MPTSLHPQLPDPSSSSDLFLSRILLLSASLATLPARSHCERILQQHHLRVPCCLGAPLLARDHPRARDANPLTRNTSCGMLEMRRGAPATRDSTLGGRSQGQGVGQPRQDVAGTAPAAPCLMCENATLGRSDLVTVNPPPLLSLATWFLHLLAGRTYIRVERWSSRISPFPFVDGVEQHRGERQGTASSNLVSPSRRPD